MDYKPTIGLEVHAELKTRTKMFCDSLNDPDEKHPNVNVCPVCMAHPGSLPVINKKAVESVLKVGLAIGAEITAVTKFDRKNYFYPDLPKGYQISQYDQPLAGKGEFAGVKIHRIHLEEDAGKLVHADDGSTLVDFNRAGVPLMELVTEPDMHSADEAVNFMKEFQLLLRYLGVSAADLERGQMRADANISISKTSELGTRVEVKNLNSFKAVAAAIEYEIKRQKEVLDGGAEIAQETRGWDEMKQKTIIQRSKEEAHDYRYFPEPDLPPMRITHGRASPAEAGGPLDIPAAFDLEDLKRHLPELPRTKQERFERVFGLFEKQAALLIEEKAMADFFEQAISELAEREEKITPEKRAELLLFNYLTSDLAGLLNESGLQSGEISARGGSAFGGKITPEHLAHLIDLLTGGKIMSRQAKDILKKMFETGDDPEDILESEGLHTISGEEELSAAVREIISENPSAVADFKKGKTASMQFLIGKAMAKLKGKGNPDMIRKILGQELIKN